MPVLSIPRSRASIFIFLSRRSAAMAVAIAITLGLACLHAGAQMGAPQPGSYTITDLGTLPGAGCTGSSAGYSINASGQVAGTALSPDCQARAVLFNAGAVTDLGVVPGASGGNAYGINGSGEVTGALAFLAPNEEYFFHAFLYSASGIQDIGTLSGNENNYNYFSIGLGINDSGQVTGDSNTLGPGPVHAFLYSERSMKDLGTLPGGGLQSEGEAINSSSQVAGWASLEGEYLTHAVLFSDGSVQDLGTLPGGGNSIGYGINDSSEVTGISEVNVNGTEYSHAFLYRAGTMIDLGALPGDTASVGTSINAAGQVVGGSSFYQDNQDHLFLYTPGQGMINLSSLLPAGSGWTLTNATAINDKGQITGIGVNPDGYQRAYLLSPVFTQFATLNAAVDLIGSPANTFAAGGRFTLGAASHGINPLTETTVLQLGGYHISIPPGSFVKQANGVYFYNGKIGNVNVHAVLTPMAANVFLFGVVGQGAVGLPPSYPLNLVLTIGTDTGFQQIDTNYNAGNLTEAQVCAAFGLTCTN